MTSVDGEITFQLKKLVVPIDKADSGKAAQGVELDGLLQLHHVTGRLSNPALQATLRIVAQILKVENPHEIRLVEDTEAAFQVREGRVFHDGLAFVLPELSSGLEVRTSGTVGLDESLDLIVQVRIPAALGHDERVSRQLSRHPFTLHVTGTLDQPRLGFPKNRNWLFELADVVLAGDEGEREHE